MTHASLFSGIGGFDLAAEWVGWENMFHCEWNEFGQKILKHYWPNAESYGDITKTDFTIWRGRIDVLTGGFPCFTSGTMILTDKGLKPIEKIHIRDKVLTLNDNWMPVNAIMSKKEAPTINIKYQGDFEPLHTTLNHPIWTKKRIFKNARLHKSNFDKPRWIESGFLKKGDLIGQRCSNGNVSYKNEAFWFMVGRFLGDGWILDGKRKSKIPKGNRGSRVNSINHKTVICCSKKEKDILNDIITNAGYKATIIQERTVYKFIISSKELTDFLRQFGRYSYGKELPGICFLLKNNLKKALFEGWQSADGYINGSIKKITTVSPILAKGMAKIAIDVYRVPISISKKNVSQTKLIEGRTVNQRNQYCLSVNLNSKVGFYENGFVWTPVKNISNGSTTIVYNIGVYKDETYTANGITVHNCQPYSVAGKRLGKEDERHLWPEMLRAIREIQPRWVVGENVSGIINWNGGLVFEEVQTDLEAQGYEVQAFILPAAGIGAPHRRDRVWFIAYSARNRYDRNSRTERDNMEWEQLKNKEQTGNGRTSETFGLSFKQLITDTESKQSEWLELGKQREISEQEQKQFRGSNSKNIITNSGLLGQEERQQQTTRIIERSCWESFPTQSFIRERNDGIPSRMVNYITKELRYEIINTSKENRIKNLHEVRERISQKEIWEKIRGFYSLESKEILLQTMQLYSREYVEQIELSPFSEDFSKIILQHLWKYGEFRCSPQGRELQKQRTEQFGNSLSFLPHEVALAARRFEAAIIQFKNWHRNESIKAYGNAIVPQVALQIFKAINQYQEIINNK